MDMVTTTFNADEGILYKQFAMTEQKVEPEGWFKGLGTRDGQTWTGFDRNFTSTHAVELVDEDDDCFIELPPVIREVLLVQVFDDGTAQAIITGNPGFAYPDNKIQLRIGDYTSAGDAEITAGGISWNTPTSVPSFIDDDYVFIEAQPATVIPHIIAQEDDEEAIFEAGITFNGRLQNVLGGRYLVIRHNDILVAYDESTGDLFDVESEEQLGNTIAGQSAITSVRLEGRRRDSLLIRGSKDYELLL